LQFQHLLVDRLKSTGRIDHHLDRQPSRAAGQRRQVERKRVDAFDLAELSLHQWLQLDRRALTFVPGLEQHACDAVLRAVDPVQGETKIRLRETPEYLVELLTVKVQI